MLTETVCKPETLRVLGLNVPEGTINGSFVSGCPGLENGMEIGRELAESAQTLGKVARNEKRPLTGFRFTGVNWIGGGSAGFQMSSPSHTLCEHGLIELGAFRINNLRRSPKIEFYPWNPISDIRKTKCEQKKRRPDGMERARYYQSLLDSGEVNTRAELARFLGVSRARVTQVLNRLETG